ncbi:MAG: gamma-glutamylcyclotransferase [Proteobacteria bacterium]|nr:gamma-glutamylcyclotransferase [Pseudomonadota bacterium]
MSDKSLEWYFAYGSNRDRGTFCGRRRIEPSDTKVGRLTNYELKFNLPVGPGNRGVANIARGSDKQIWGVAYQITSTEGRRLDRSEGVQRDFYRRIPVTIELQDDHKLEAFTYASSCGRPGRLPSPRYLGLIVNGARYHGLPDHWIDRLQGWPLAVDERVAKQGTLF